MLRRSKRLALRDPTISNLPDDVIRQCLLRVSYKSHSKLKAVCRKWRDVVGKPEFYKDRMTTGTREHLICMIQCLRRRIRSTRYRRQRRFYFIRGICRIIVLDPVRYTWTVLRHMPDFPTGVPLFCECVCFNGKLVLMGGLHPQNWHEMSKRVYIFDFVSAKWLRGADMPTRRIGFACSVCSSTGLIYVAGGKDDQNDLLTVEAYNVEEDKWETLSPMSQQLGDCHGVFLGGEFIVFGENGNNAEIFYPKTGLWRRVDDMWRFGSSFRFSLVASGNLYTFTERQLIKYEAEKNNWLLETVLPTNFRGAVCTTEWRGHIFVSSPHRRRQVCYLLNPSTGELIQFYVPRNFVGLTLSAATVEI
jgi:hypothetical protein